MVRKKGKGNDYKKMERLDPGPITSTFLKKSKSRSSAPKESSKAFLTTKPAPKEKKVSLLNKLFLQNVAILKCLWKSEEKRKKDKKERRQLAREVGQLKHELHWHTNEAWLSMLGCGVDRVTLSKIKVAPHCGSVCDCAGRPLDGNPLRDQSGTTFKLS
ncbi:hypothetical protein RHGRI_029570 [Rhododendron griersonianum]|uniref:Uncharacterized protein n=1 Tax=Rhododendron griersonianum TaxID=479676 RepID=A0AAV6IK06_9ERIC|nr:hypothetical protein RHGRI_029570 [Rhododendron griersonianum]